MGSGKRASRWSEAHERMRIATEMERILRLQASPDKPCPIVEFWEYLDRRESSHG